MHDRRRMFERRAKLSDLLTSATVGQKAVEAVNMHVAAAARYSALDRI